MVRSALSLPRAATDGFFLHFNSFPSTDMVLAWVVFLLSIAVLALNFIAKSGGAGL